METQSIMARSGWWNRAAQFMATGKEKIEREKEEGADQGPNILLKGMPPVTQFPSTRSHLTKVPPPPSSATSWGKSLY
jgi:hypothetical protein